MLLEPEFFIDAAAGIFSSKKEIINAISGGRVLQEANRGGVQSRVGDSGLGTGEIMTPSKSEMRRLILIPGPPRLGGRGEESLFDPVFCRSDSILRV